MIALAEDFLLFRLASGESVAFSAEMIANELLDGTVKPFDPEFIRHAANAVFYYFKHELDRETVTVEEFSTALDKVLRGFPPTVLQAPAIPASGPGMVESDLRRLAVEAGAGCELVFFPRLRAELRERLRQEPRLLRFHGLRGCVKQLAGARRWNPRCQKLEDRIVEYLRQCLSAEVQAGEFALVVD
jgi:hypothetical protein